MKNLKILIVSIFLLNITQSNALEICFSDGLIETMAEDQQVLKLINDSYKISLIKYFGTKHIPSENSNDYKNLLTENTKNAKEVNKKYPIFDNMNFSERKAIIERISEIKSEYVYSSWSCIRDRTIVLVSGLSGIRWWKEAKFAACMTAAVIADGTAEVASGGANTVLLPEELSEEVYACLQFTGLSAGDAGAIGVYVGSIIVCILNG
ncbi:MAG: hypothetical protein ACI9Y7_001563 [Dokdonia sp.]|jgi:hypothetical protein